MTILGYAYMPYFLANNLNAPWSLFSIKMLTIIAVEYGFLKNIKVYSSLFKLEVKNYSSYWVGGKPIPYN